MAQSVRRPTLGFHSGRDLGVLRWSPVSGSALSRVCPRFIPPLTAPLPPSHSRFLPPPLFKKKKNSGHLRIYRRDSAC